MLAIIEPNNYVKDKRLRSTSVVDDVLMKLMKSMIDERPIDRCAFGHRVSGENVFDFRQSTERGATQSAQSALLHTRHSPLTDFS